MEDKYVNGCKTKQNKKKTLFLITLSIRTCLIRLLALVTIKTIKFACEFSRPNCRIIFVFCYCVLFVVGECKNILERQTIFLTYDGMMQISIRFQIIIWKLIFNPYKRNKLISSKVNYFSIISFFVKWYSFNSR